MTTLHVGNQRLLRLADRLAVVDKERAKAKLPPYNQAAYAHLCGTPACALGEYAAMNPRRWIPAKVFVNMYGDKAVSVPKLKNQSVAAGSAVHEFALSEIEQDYELFGAYGCNSAKTGKDAAKYIRKFVANRKREALKAKAA